MCITGAAFLLLCPVLLCRSARRRSSRPTWHEVLEAEGGGRRRGGGRAVKASPSPVKAAVQRALNGPQFAVGSGYNDYFIVILQVAYVDFVGFDLGVLSTCPFAMPNLPNFHPIKQNQADRETTKSKTTKCSVKPPWSPRTLTISQRFHMCHQKQV